MKEINLNQAKKMGMSAPFNLTRTQVIAIVDAMDDHGLANRKANFWAIQKDAFSGVCEAMQILGFDEDIERLKKQLASAVKSQNRPWLVRLEQELWLWLRRFFNKSGGV